MTIEYTLENGPRSSVDLVAQQHSGRPCRIACLLALAHRLDDLVRSGTVKDYAELARLGHITRARVSQIVNLLNLAPEIQEYLLWLPSECAREVTERDLRRIAGEVRWDRQRERFYHGEKSRRRDEPAAAEKDFDSGLIRPSPSSGAARLRP
jgi:hypothetical protein